MYAGYRSEPVSPDADRRQLVHVRLRELCGHGVIALATAAVEDGWVVRVEPETRVGIDALCGFIEARFLVTAARGSVGFVNVPSFRFMQMPWRTRASAVDGDIASAAPTISIRTVARTGSRTPDMPRIDPLRCVGEGRRRMRLSGRAWRSTAQRHLWDAHHGDQHDLARRWRTHASLSIRPSRTARRGARARPDGSALLCAKGPIGARGRSGQRVGDRQRLDGSGAGEHQARRSIDARCRPVSGSGAMSVDKATGASVARRDATRHPWFVRAGSTWHSAPLMPTPTLPCKRRDGSRQPAGLSERQ